MVMLYCLTTVFTYRFTTGSVRTGFAKAIVPLCTSNRLLKKKTSPPVKLTRPSITGFAAVALNPDSHAPREAKVLSKPFHLRDLVNEVHKMLAA